MLAERLLAGKEAKLEGQRPAHYQSSVVGVAIEGRLIEGQRLLSGPRRVFGGRTPACRSSDARVSSGPHALSDGYLDLPPPRPPSLVCAEVHAWQQEYGNLLHCLAWEPYYATERHVAVRRHCSAAAAAAAAR